VEADLDSADFEGLSIRERLELHKQEGAACFGCHSTMDPIGLGLENFDGIGQYRTQDADTPIDASGALPGEPPLAFNGPAELASLVGGNPDFSGCVTEHLATYAVGARAAHHWVEDMSAQASLYAGAAPDLKSIARAIAVSAFFTTRRASTPEEGITP
jgi:hypothetical protein